VLARSKEVLARRNEVFTADEVVPTTPSDNKRKKAALKSKDLSPWQHSKSRDRLRRMMLDPESRIHSTDLATIHNDTEEFRRRPFKKFQEYYNSLQKKIEKDRALVKKDEADFVHDRALYPRGARDITGQPFYDTHQSKVLLTAEAKAMTGRKPSAICNDDPCHSEFSLKAFRQHLYQEKRKEKERPAWQFRRNKAGRRQHEKDSEEENVQPT
jgi:hypothetical protein